LSDDDFFAFPRKMMDEKVNVPIDRPSYDRFDHCKSVM